MCSGGAASHARLEKITLPGGREIYYNYEDANAFMSLGRVANIAANGSPTDAQKYVAYKYLGASTVVDANHPAVPTGLRLTYAGSTSGDYSGLDRLGRVVWQRWLRTDGASAADRHFYGYDRAGNRTWRAERADLSVAGGRDEAYVYDKLDRLVGAKRGILPDKPYQAPYPGDATLDGTVDGFDSTVLLLNWLGSGKTWTQADFNGDGKVDGFDNTILGDNWLADPNETVARSWSWSLTPTGNWSSSMINDANQTRTHDKANQITSISGIALAPLYDQAGSNVRGPRPADPNANNAAHFRYDAWNRLATIHLDNGSASGTLDANDTLLATYRYDGLNRRVMKAIDVDGNSVTDYVFFNEGHGLRSLGEAGWQIVEVRRAVNGDPSAAAPYKQYAWDIRYIDAPVCRWWDDDANSATAAKVQYFTNDGNFNTTALVDGNSGSVVERYLYDPYGKVTVLNGASGAEKDPNVAEWSPDADNKSDWDNEVLFCGYWYDAETGLFHVRERYYDPLTGTWKTRDRILYPDGMNLYEYCRSSPQGSTDAYGLFSAEAYSSLIAQAKAEAARVAQGPVWNKADFEKIEGLCNCTCLRIRGHLDDGDAGTRIDECRKQAREIYGAYIAFLQKKSKEPRNYKVSPPLDLFDYHAGYMCLTWQAMTYDALSTYSTVTGPSDDGLPEDGKYFAIDMVGKLGAASYPRYDTSLERMNCLLTANGLCEQRELPWILRKV